VAIKNTKATIIKPIISARNIFLLDVITGAIIIYERFVSPISGNTRLPGSKTAIIKEIGTNNSPKVIISGSPTRSAKSIPILNSLFGNFAAINSLVAVAIGDNPSIKIEIILGRRNIAAAIVMPTFKH